MSTYNFYVQAETEIQRKEKKKGWNRMDKRYQVLLGNSDSPMHGPVVY